MRLQRINELVNFKPWLITPTAHASIRDLVARHAAAPRSDDLDQGFADLVVQRDPMTVTPGGVAVISVRGVVGQGMSRIEKACGNTGTEEVGAELAQAVADDQVGGILLDIDSPGGTVGGVPELADAIAAANGEKPVYAFTAGMLCSAAYWLAAGATGIFATRSADVGSVGVYLPWIDTTIALAQAGVSVEIIRNAGADLKGAGYPGTSLTPEQRAYLQADVDEVAAMFQDHVLGNRPDIAADALRGQSLLADSALAAGLIDGVVRDRSEVLAFLSPA